MHRATAPKRLNRNRRFDQNAGNSRKVGLCVEDVLPPRTFQISATQNVERLTTNRCCFASPEQKDFAQVAGFEQPTKQADRYRNILQQQYGFDPNATPNVVPLVDLQKLPSPSIHKVENASQSNQPVEAVGTQPIFVQTSDGTQWQNLDCPDELDDVMEKKVTSPIPAKRSVSQPHLIRISESPRVKVIAAKFRKYSSKDVEVRRLDEKVVCLEYDVFSDDGKKPVQKMRAFFSIKPAVEGADVLHDTTNDLPTSDKDKSLPEDDMSKFTKKEIEIIDGKINENRSYLDDLISVLQQKQISYDKNKTSLDLFCLYEMAKQHHDTSRTNFLSKEELMEIKNLILKQSKSSVNGISRRTVRHEENDSNIKDLCLISKSMVKELMRQ